LEIWNFCYTLKDFLGISNFSVEELNEAIKANDEEKGFLFGVLVQILIQGYIKDVKDLNEKEIYTTPAILVLELAEDLVNFPLEAIVLIFSIKKYKRTIDSSILEHLKLITSKSSNLTNKIHELDYNEKKQLLLILTRGLYVAPKLHEIANKSTQRQKNQRHLEKQKASLQKEVSIFESAQKSENPIEITREKKKEINGISKEIAKISNEIKKKSRRKTMIIGIDAEGKEYWIFAGDKTRVYIREVNEDKEIWNTYSTLKQVNELLNVLCEKGINEKKLKDKLSSLLPSIQLKGDKNSVEL
jgi:hypothetical protein